MLAQKLVVNNKEVKKYLKLIQIISKKNDLNLKINLIFFPHWSYLVDKKITNKFKCICFHSAPLPYGRGGSPIQNLIVRDFKQTPVCAIEMTEKIDAGGIYLKQNLSLKGDLNDILNSMSVKILRMMKIILKKKNYTKKTKRQSFVFQKT